MAKICDICERGPVTANWRSHSNVAAKRRQMVNLQTRHIGGRRMKVCTRCLRNMTKAAR
jgi:large subunit ribosomal protein L28